MKKISSLLLTFGSFLVLEPEATTAAPSAPRTMWDGPLPKKVVHYPTGPKVDHKLEVRREQIRKEINGAHKILSQFSHIYGKMHAMRLEVETMNEKVRGKPVDQKRLVALEKEWNKDQSALRLTLVKKKIPAFDNLPSERDIWGNFPDDEARTLEGTLREIRKWQSYENIDLRTGQAKPQGGNLDDDAMGPTTKFDPRKGVSFSALRDSDDEEDF